MARAERLVLDASYLLEALLPTTPAWQLEAFDLIDRMAAREVRACVPGLFFAEVAAVLSRKIRSGHLLADDAQGFLEHLDVLPLDVDRDTLSAAGLYRCAAHWHCGVFDAAYLHTATRLELPVATRDRGMSTAATLAGVGLFQAAGQGGAPSPSPRF